MRSVASSIRLYGTTAVTSIRERTAYFADYTSGMLTYGLFIFVFSRVWASAYAGQSEIAGYTNTMAVWYFVVAELVSFAFGGHFMSLSRDMKSGQISYLVSRPYGFVTYHLAERIGGSLPGLLVFMAEGFVVGLVLAGPPPAIGGALEIGRAVLTAASLLLGGMINFFLQFSIAMTAFWLEENDAMYWIYQKLVLVVGTLVPLEFLPDAAARIAAWTPFAYIAYAPARIFTAFSVPEALSLVGRQAAWLLFAALLSKAVFALGVKRISVNGG